MNFSRRIVEVNIQDTSLTFFNIFNNCFAGCLQKVSTQTFYFLPIQGNPIGPLVPTTVGLKFGSTYNKTTVKYFSLCLFVTNYCQTCINRLLHPRLPDSVVLFLNTVAHRCLTLTFSFAPNKIFPNTPPQSSMVDQQKNAH